MLFPTPLRELPADHIDLLMTAALELGVLIAPPEVSRPETILRALAHRVGSCLWERNASSGATPYRFQPVAGALDMVEVLKASHAAQHAYAATRLWGGSPEKAVVDAVAKAASMRTPGYDLAPWLWRRATINAVGLAPQGTWHPMVDGLEWVGGVDELVEHWKDTRIVVLTLAGLELLPELPARARVFVLVDQDESCTVIPELDHTRIVEGVLVWPAAQSWLEQLILL